MRAGRIVAPGKVELGEIDEPEVGEGQHLVRVTHFGICGSDLPFYEGEAQEYPMPWGAPVHEVLGQVETGLTTSPTRSRVIVVTTQGMAERAVVDASKLLPLPDGPAPEHILMAQPLGTVVHALRKMPSMLGLRATIIGAGPIGLLFVAMMRNLGCRHILAIDPRRDRLERAKTLGAAEIVAATAEEAAQAGVEQADVVVEAVGLPGTLRAAPYLARRGGWVVMFGVPRRVGPAGLVGMDAAEMLRRELHIVFSHGPELHADIATAAHLIANGTIDVRPIVSHVLEFSQVGEAFEMASKRADGVCKVVVRVGE